MMWAFGVSQILFSVTVLLCLEEHATVHGFTPAARQNVSRRPIPVLYVKKPKFNSQTQKWERAADDDGVYPYDVVGALLRHGPSPFLTRLTNAKEYEQGVLKYMAVAGVSRAEATGNVDAKLNNAMDWQFQKTAEKNGKPKVDYTELKKKDAILVVVWAFGITPLAISVIYDTFSQFGSSYSPVLDNIMKN